MNTKQTEGYILKKRIPKKWSLGKEDKEKFMYLYKTGEGISTHMDWHSKTACQIQSCFVIEKALIFEKKEKAGEVLNLFQRKGYYSNGAHKSWILADREGGKIT